MRLYDAEKWNFILTRAGCDANTADKWAPVFHDTMKADTFSKGDADQLDFLATVLHESQMLTKLKENGNYSAKRIIELGNASPVGSRWRSLVPQAKVLANNPQAFFEAVYGGRLGNDQPGDGAKYLGRGLIMITGKANYEWLGNIAGQDLVVNPELLEHPHFALELSIDWWEGKVPDSILGDNAKVRRVVNGGTFGLREIETLVLRLRGALR